MLERAETYIMSLQKQTTIFWMTLLAASRNYNNTKMAKKAATEILKKEPNNSGACVLLSNTYAASGKWKEKNEVWKYMIDNNIQKMPGATWVTIGEITEMFCVDSNHSYYYSFSFFLFSCLFFIFNCF